MIINSSKLCRLTFVLFCILLSNSLITAKRVGKKATRTRHPAKPKLARKLGSLRRSNNLLEYDCKEVKPFYLPFFNGSVLDVPIIKTSKTESCNINIFGSRIHECQAHIICYDIETDSTKSSKKTNSAKSSKKTNSGKSSSKCTDAYFKITDGMGGEEFGCGNSLTLGKYLKPSKFGHDLYLQFQGTSGNGYCRFFCGKDEPGITARALNVETKNERKTAECECGVHQGNQQQGRVVGGENAIPFEFPWLAALIKTPAYYGREARLRAQFCGGSLITDRHILTAAHCFFDKETFVPTEPEAVQVLLHAHVMDFVVQGLSPEEEAELRDSIPGGHLPPVSDAEENSLRMEVEKIVTHPLYLPTAKENFDFDVAILVLKTKVDFKKSNQNIRPICLYPESETAVYYADHDFLQVTGWGAVIEGGHASARILQKTHVPVVSRARCADRLGKDFYFPGRQMCAYYEDKEQDVCQGDSGGPAFGQRQGKSANYQVGLVSFGFGCARPGYPGFYTDVFEVQEWIYHHTRSHGVWCKNS